MTKKKHRKLQQQNNYYIYRSVIINTFKCDKLITKKKEMNKKKDIKLLHDLCMAGIINLPIRIN